MQSATTECPLLPSSQAAHVSERLSEGPYKPDTTPSGMLNRHSLMLRFAGVPALVLLTLTGLLYLGTTHLVAQELNSQAKLRIEQRSRLLAERLATALNASVRGVQDVARFESRTWSANQMPSRTELEWARKGLPHYVWMGFINSDGIVRVATDGLLEGQYVAERPVFKQGRHGLMLKDFHKPVALAPYLQQADVGPMLEIADIAVPVRDRKGAFQGVIAAHIGTRWVFELASSTLSDAEARQLGLSWYIVTGDGAVLSKDNKLPFAVPRQAGAAVPATSRDGRNFLVATNTVGVPGSMEASLGWRVVMASNGDTTLEPLRKFHRNLAIFAFFGAGVFALGGFLVARRTLRPFGRVFDVLGERFHAAGAEQYKSYGEYLESISDELALELPQDPLGGGDILLRLARDAKQLRRVIDHFPLGLAISNTDFRVEYVNPAYTRMLGWTRASVYNRRAGEFLMDDELRKQFQMQLDQVRQSPAELVARFDAQCADGSTLPIQWQLIPLYGQTGEFSGIMTLVQDLSEQVAAAGRAQALASRLQMFADAAVGYGLILLDARGRVLTWSRGAEALTGMRAEEAVCQSFAHLFSPAERAMDVPAQLLEQAFVDGEVDVYARFLRKDSEKGFMGSGAMYAVRDANDSAAFVLIVHDTTQQHEAIERQREHEHELAALAQRLLQQEKQTTHRLGQSLHDVLGQTLGAMRIIFDAAVGRQPADERPAWLRRLDALISAGNTQIRAVLTNLRPPLLDEEGLIAALDNECRHRQGLVDTVKVQLSVVDTPPQHRWRPDVEYAAFMVAREAVINAHKHAGASLIQVELTGDEFYLELSVKDNGKGTTVARPKAGHLGLVDMRERALAIGATLTIRSVADQGTTVTICWEIGNDKTVSH